MKLKVFILLLCCSMVAISAQDMYEFSSNAQRNRFYALIANFRCLVCQNETLADSNAPLAQDLRDNILQQINEGATDEQITDYLVGRYGDFVLYNPAFNVRTYLLWLLPIIMLLSGFGFMIYYVKRQKKVE